MSDTTKFRELSTHVVELLGGSDNIEQFAHCVTRLRFNVRDTTKVQAAEIEKLGGVLGSQWAGHQFQVIIGQSVGDAYKMIMKVHALSGAGGVDEVLDADLRASQRRRFRVSDVIDAIAGSVVPVIPVLIGCGMLKVLLLLLTQVGWLDAAGSTYLLLSWAADAGFYFLPVLIGKTAAKRFGANEGLGMVLGAMLVYPAFVAAVTDGTALTFLGIPVYGASYAYSVFPAILAAALLAPVQRFFGRISPDAIRSLSEPLLTLLVMVPVTMLAIAPAGAFLGQYLSEAMLWLYDVTGPLGVAVMAAAVPLLVITGMHAAFTPYLIQMFSTVGREPIFIPAMVINNINQGVAAAAVALRTRDKRLRTTAISTAVTAIVGGVTEPAMFGINLRLRRPLYGAMIGSFAGGLYVGLQDVAAHAFITSGGLFAVPGFIGPDGTKDVVNLVIGWVIGAVVTFAVTLLLYREKPVASTEAPAPAVAPATNQKIEVA